MSLSSCALSATSGDMIAGCGCWKEKKLQKIWEPKWNTTIIFCLGSPPWPMSIIVCNIVSPDVSLSDRQWSWSHQGRGIQIEEAEQPGGGAPLTDHILYLISDLQTMTCSLIGQSARILGPHWSADNEGCPHGTPGLTGHRAERRYLI